MEWVTQNIAHHVLLVDMSTHFQDLIMDLGNIRSDADSVYLTACFDPNFKARQLKPLSISIILTKHSLD